MLFCVFLNGVPPEITQLKQGFNPLKGDKIGRTTLKGGQNRRKGGQNRRIIHKAKGGQNRQHPYP